MELTCAEERELKYLLEIAIKDTKDSFRMANRARHMPGLDEDEKVFNLVACKENARLLQIYRDIYHKIGS